MAENIMVNKLFIIKLLFYCGIILFFNSCKDYSFNNPVDENIHHSEPTFTSIFLSDTVLIVSITETSIVPDNIERRLLSEYSVNETDYKNLPEATIQNRIATVTIPPDFPTDVNFTFRARLSYGGNITPYTQTETKILKLRPDSLKSTFTSDNSVKLQWIDRSSLETGFEIFQKEGKNGEFKLRKTVPANIQQDTLISLTDTLYEYQIRAITPTRKSGYSNSSTAIYLQSLLLAVPENFTAQFISDESAKLTWVDKSSKETGFDLWVSNGNTGDYYKLITLPANSQEFTIGGLTDAIYAFKLKSVNNTRQSEFSNIAVAEFAVLANSSAPSNMTAEFISDQSAKLTWKDNSNYETGFELWISNGNTEDYYNLITLPANSQEFIIGGLTDSIYAFKLRAINNTRQSAFSSNSVLSSKLAPSNLTAEFISDQSAKLTWKDNSNYETGFELWISNGNTGIYYKLITLPVNSQEFTISNLTDTIYAFKIKAISGSRQSVFSNNAIAAFSVLASNSAPSNLSAVFTTWQDAQLSWIDNCSFESGYEIWVSNGSTGSYYNLITIPSDSKQYSIGSLTSQSKYSFKVRAKFKKYFSEFSNVTSIEKSVPTAPSLSAPVNAATGQSGTPTLVWNASPMADSYTLQVSTNSSFTSYIYNQSGLTAISQQITELSGSTTYYWRVSAANTLGNSSYSSVYSFTIGSVYYLNEGFESTSLPSGWVTNSSYPWITTTATYGSGARSIKSGTIPNSVSTYIYKSVTFTDSSTKQISFKYKTSSEPNYDYLNFYINGVLQTSSWSGVMTSFSTATYSFMGTGTIEFRWTYTKDGSGTLGDDAVYIDDVRVY